MRRHILDALVAHIHNAPVAQPRQVLRPGPSHALPSAVRLPSALRRRNLRPLGVLASMRACNPGERSA